LDSKLNPKGLFYLNLDLHKGFAFSAIIVYKLLSFGTSCSEKFILPKSLKGASSSTYVSYFTNFPQTQLKARSSALLLLLNSALATNGYILEL